MIAMKSPTPTLRCTGHIILRRQKFYHCAKHAFVSTKYIFIYFRRYGTKCSVCDVGIAPSETVQRALGRVYHLACFTCLVCHKELSTGDRFYLTKEGKVLCKDDYEIKSREKGEQLWSVQEISSNSFKVSSPKLIVMQFNSNEIFQNETLQKRYLIIYKSKHFSYQNKILEIKMNSQTTSKKYLPKVAYI